MFLTIRICIGESQEIEIFSKKLTKREIKFSDIRSLVEPRGYLIKSNPDAIKKDEKSLWKFYIFAYKTRTPEERMSISTKFLMFPARKNE